MRKLILVTRARYYRDFVSTGAFEVLDDDETFYVGGPGAISQHFEGHPRYLGAVEMPKERSIAYGDIRKLMLTAYRFKSRTARVKLQQRPFLTRLRAKARALPFLRERAIARRMEATGLHPGLSKLIEETAPDIVIAPSAGMDALVIDAARICREAGIPSLALMYNWDNLSSKAAFAVEPDFLAVAGHQGAAHAEQIHGISEERVGVLGSPYIDGHFKHPPGSTESPFPFPYVLFAGCYQPFDELTALQQLEDAIESNGLDLKIVYLPHPARLPRKRSDFVDESKFKHVLLEPRMVEEYARVWRHYEEGQGGVAYKMGMRQLPPDAYPALLENAEFVVCPLSTMMLEAAIFRRRVLVIAHHDDLHHTSPGVAIKYMHFEGVEGIETFRISRKREDLPELFAEMARDPSPPRQPPKDQMDYWVYHDERSFSARLAAWVDEIYARTTGRGTEPISATQSASRSE